MTKLTRAEFDKAMWAHGKDHNNNEDYKDSITGVIVFKESNWDRPYSEESRSYRVSSCNRCYQSGKTANSLYGNCLDGTDHGVRLDWYNWDVDYCYLDSNACEKE